MSIVTKPASKDYLDNYDRIFNKDSVLVIENNQKDSQNGRKKRDAQEAAKSRSNGGYKS